MKTSSNPEKMAELAIRHNRLMNEQNICISVYPNASQFFWSMCKCDSGTNLGYCGDGRNRWHGYDKYEDALADALDLATKTPLEAFVKDTPKRGFHWSNYARHIMRKGQS